jgi:RNA polymerase sigma factor (sigma-70 family)
MEMAEASGAWSGWPHPGTSVTVAYEAYAGELERYVARAFGGRVVPEDVVHEAFARLIRETSAGREPTLVRAWLYRVVRNLAVSELRRPARWEPRWEPGVDGERAPGPSVRSAEAEHEALTLSSEVREALGTLSRAGRTSILMAADGYSGREIAAAVGRSELATRTLLCRTRQILRVMLASGGPVTEWDPARRLAA